MMFFNLTEKMGKYMFWAVLLVALISEGFAKDSTPKTLPLPKYINACKVGKDFDTCAVKSGQAAIEQIAKGDGRYKIPVMDPMSIQKIEVLDGGKRSVSLNITLKNVKIVGLGNAKFIQSKLDYPKKKLDLGFYSERFSILCDYDINGRFLVLPIVGKGPGNFTLTKVKFVYQLEWKTEKKNGIDHMVVSKVKLTYDPQRVYIALKNLFNGDRRLDSSMNQLLNENWQDLNSAIGPSVAEAIGLAIKSTLDAITKLVPENLIFLKA